VTPLDMIARWPKRSRHEGVGFMERRRLLAAGLNSRSSS
jgi:hypothetical protein